MSANVAVLNLITHFEGEEQSDAIQRATELVRIVESAGYERYWVAEHHNFAGALSSSTDTIIQHLLQNSSTIRVGAGGVMLPNHSTLQVAETYGTLELLYPNRVDLGLGRAPGTDPQTARIIYRGDTSNEGFSRAIMELQRYFGSMDQQGPVVAYPGVNTQVPLYILGSSTNSAYVAAEFGLPYSFASHFAPHYLEEALAIYRNHFKPSAQLEKPYVIMGIVGNAAETNEEAEYLYTSMQQNNLNLAKGQQGLQPLPSRNIINQLTSAEKLFIESRTGLSLVGDKDTITEQWQKMESTYQPDEVIVVSYLPTIEQLATSYEMIADVVKNS